MRPSDITNYIQKMHELIQMQQIELDKTRNLLGRALESTEYGEITSDKKEYSVPDEVSFDLLVRFADVNIYSVVLPPPMKSMYEQITELKKELNL